MHHRNSVFVRNAHTELIFIYPPQEHNLTNIEISMSHHCHTEFILILLCARKYCINIHKNPLTRTNRNTHTIKLYELRIIMRLVVLR